jgi:plastocyanin
MKRMDRRTFMLVAAAGGTGAVLVACGNDPDSVDLNPTMIPVDGAPPTLAPMATPGGGAEAADAGADAGGDEAPADAAVVSLEAQDPFSWSTNELEAAPGQTIQVTNAGALEHDFVIDELEISEALPSGEPVDIVLPDDLTVGDTYTYYCSVPGHRESGMEGTLTIVEASAPAEEAAPAEEEAAGGTDAGGPVMLEAQDPFNWSTNELEAAPGQTIQVTNAGVMEHDFVIDELGISEALPSGEPVEVTLPDDLTVGDTYTYYCSVPGHRESGMEGTLTIVEASAQPRKQRLPRKNPKPRGAPKPLDRLFGGTGSLQLEHQRTGGRARRRYRGDQRRCHGT